jgi:sugar-specific transcriptional regulator TrmB
LIQEEQLQALRSLGLTFVQSKAYLNLAKLGSADTKTIATASGIARQDTYRIMSSLEEVGLAEKIVGKTTMYKATPIKEGLSLLLQNKKKDYIESKKQVKSILANFYENADQIKLHDVQFTITSELNLLIKMHEKLADMTKYTIDIAVPIRINQKMAFENMQYLNSATRRGVKIRFISQESNGDAIVEDPKHSSKDPLLELRHLPETAIRFGMHIFDKREMTMAISENKPMPSLWTNSPHVIELASAYFESMWSNAKQIL